MPVQRSQNELRPKRCGFVGQNASISRNLGAWSLRCVGNIPNFTTNLEPKLRIRAETECSSRTTALNQTMTFPALRRHCVLLLSFSLFLLSLFPLVLRSQPVEIPDPALRAALGRALQLPPNSIDVQSMKTLTEFDIQKLRSNEPQIRSLEGLNFAENLTSLNLSFCRITNFSALASFTKLTNLDLSLNQLTNLTVPRGLIQLRSLRMARNPLQFLGSEESLTNLQSLDLTASVGSDGLLRAEFAPYLSSLILAENFFLTNLSFLLGFQNLTSLDLSLNSSFRPIPDFPEQFGVNLTNLNVSGNVIGGGGDSASLSFLSRMPNLRSLHLSYCRLHTFDLPEGTIPHLVTLDLSQNAITNISFATRWKELAVLSLANSVSQTLEALELPQDLEGLSLDLTGARIHHLTLESQYSKLSSLSLGGSEWGGSSLPEGLGSLTNLSLRSMGLQSFSLPPGMTNLRSLSVIELGYLTNFSISEDTRLLTRLVLVSLPSLVELRVPNDLSKLVVMIGLDIGAGNLEFSGSLPLLSEINVTFFGATDTHGNLVRHRLTLPSGLPSLKSFTIGGTITNLVFPEFPETLANLNVSIDTPAQLSFPADLPNLTNLFLTGPISPLSLPASMSKLDSFSLRENPRVTSLVFPSLLPSLHTVFISGNAQLANLALATNSPQLRNISISNNPKLNRYEFPVELPQLKSLSLLGGDPTRSVSLKLPERMPNVGALTLWNLHLSDLTLPGGMGSLTNLQIQNCALTNLVFQEDLGTLQALTLFNNQLRTLFIPAAFRSLASLQIDAAPLSKLLVPAGIPVVTPSVAQLRSSGTDVTIAPVVRSAHILPNNLLQFTVLAESGPIKVLRSPDLVTWTEIGSLDSGISEQPGSLFTDIEPLETGTAFYAVGLPPTVLKQPQELRLLLDGNGELSVKGGGYPPPSYQWFHDGLLISGATETNLHLTNVQVSDSGKYSVRLSNIAGQVMSDEVDVKVGVVDFPDPALAIEIRAALRKPEGDITPIDMEQLSDLSLYSAPIQSLEGLSNAKNLRSLVVVDPGKFPTGLSSLTNLEVYATTNVIWPNDLTNLVSLKLHPIGSSRVLSLPRDLAKLRTLSITDGENMTLVLPSGMKQLEKLQLEGLKSVSFPSDLVSLQEMSFKRNQFTFLSLPPSLKSLTRLRIEEYPGASVLKTLTLPVGMTHLSTFTLSNTAVSRVSIPADATQLTELSLFQNPLTTLILPPSLPELRTFAVSGTGLTVLNLPNGMSHLSSFELSASYSLKALDLPKGLDELTTINLSSTGLERLEFQESLKSLNSLDLSFCPLTHLSLLPGAKNLQRLKLKGTLIPDLSFLEGMSDLRLADFSSSGFGNVSLPTGLEQLEVLTFNGCGSLTNLTLAGDLRRLKTLNLASCPISSLTIPPELNSLSELDVSGTQLANLTLPTELTNLTSLAVSSFSLTNLSLPRELSDLTNFNLAGNPMLRQLILPGGTGGALNLSGTALEDVSFLEGQSNLTSLVVTPTSVTNLVIPSGLTRLQALAVGGSQITRLTLPNDLTSLEGLVVSGTSLSELALPSSLRNLRTLSLSAGNLSQLLIAPNLTQLESVEVSYNNLSSLVLPKGATNLTIFHAIHNQLTNLVVPDSLAHLRIFEASFNQLTEMRFPEGMSKLEWLDLSSNSLTNFVLLPGPGAAFNVLNLSQNHLTTLQLPAGLVGLRSLYLSVNQLTELSVPEDMSHLDVLYVFGNNLTRLMIPAGLESLAGDSQQIIRFPRIIYPSHVDSGIDNSFTVVGDIGTVKVFQSEDLISWKETGAFPIVALGGFGSSALFKDPLSRLRHQTFYRVEQATTISTQPENQTSIVGGTVQLSVQGAGYPVVLYQWFHDGVAIPDATNAVLTLTNLSHADAGKYTAVVSNSRLSSVTSSVATIKTLDIPTGDLVVTNTDDSGLGSLRLAIQVANIRPDTNQITFRIPGTGPFVIRPVTPLPEITSPVILDGTTQPGFKGTPLIGLRGDLEKPGVSGLVISAPSVVKGLAINGWPQNGMVLKAPGGNIIQGNYIGFQSFTEFAPGNLGHGILISNSSANRIGGTQPGEGNVIGGNAQSGVALWATNSVDPSARTDENVIQGNRIGWITTQSLPAIFNGGSGVQIIGSCSNTWIGGNTAAAGNNLSGNEANGIEIVGDASDTRVQGNRIGIAEDGATILGNFLQGVLITGRESGRYPIRTLIGGTNAGQGNVIAGNNVNGIEIQGRAEGIQIIGNFIGTNPQGTQTWPNSFAGISISQEFSATLESLAPVSILNNKIAHNYHEGINVEDRRAPNNPFNKGILIRKNSIFANQLQGIFLGPTGWAANDAGDTDEGANGQQNFPELVRAIVSLDGTVEVRGRLGSRANTSYTLDFYASAQCDFDGEGEGQTWLTSTVVQTDSVGSAEFSVVLGKLPEGQKWLTATATDPEQSTSGFSTCLDESVFEGSQAPTIAQQPLGASTFLGWDVLLSVADLGSGPLTYQWFHDNVAVAAGTNASLVLDHAKASDAGNYFLIISNTLGSVTSQVASVSLKALPSDAILVVNALDEGTGSLRQAILDANTAPGTNTILFRIPGSGLVSISPSSPLPSITDPVVIDGTTQSGFNGSPKIELRGDMAGSVASGLVLEAPSTVRGLCINRFELNGIELSAPGYHHIVGNYIGTDITGTKPLPNNGAGILTRQAIDSDIGGSTAADRNLISGNRFSGVEIAEGATDIRIRGNYIGTDITGLIAMGNRGAGVLISSASRVSLGGSQPGDGNLISGNLQSGVNLNINLAQNPPLPTDANVIQGNRIGVGVDGITRLANGGSGVLIFGNCSKTLVGGTNALSGNTISGNQFNGVEIVGNASDTQVLGNRIGTDDLGYSIVQNLLDGILISAGGIGGAPIGTHIGSTNVGGGNVISGNSYSGIEIDARGSGTRIEGNFIGTDPRLISRMGNTFAGIFVSQEEVANAANTGPVVIERNVIAFNLEAGVDVQDRRSPNNPYNTRITIRRNSIFENRLLGIDLQPTGTTPNDKGDADNGANIRQNYPVLTNVVVAADGKATVQGKLNSKGSQTYTLDFYSNVECDPSGYGEGQTWLQSTTVKTDSVGNVDFSVDVGALPANHKWITATATDPAQNTSEFSLCQTTLPVQTSNPTVNVDFNFSQGSTGTYAARGAAPDQGTIWNALTATGGFNSRATSSALRTSTGEVTPITVSLVDVNMFDAGETRSILAPALFGDFAFQIGTGSTFSIDHLDAAATYDLYLFGQNGGFANTATRFTIDNGPSAVASNAGNDVTTFTRDVNYVLFTGLKADANGRITGTFNVAISNNNAAFNGLQLVIHP